MAERLCCSSVQFFFFHLISWSCFLVHIFGSYTFKRCFIRQKHASFYNSIMKYGNNYTDFIYKYNEQCIDQNYVKWWKVKFLLNFTGKLNYYGTCSESGPSQCELLEAKRDAATLSIHEIGYQLSSKVCVRVEHMKGLPSATTFSGVCVVGCSCRTNRSNHSQLASKYSIGKSYLNHLLVNNTKHS